VFDNLAVPVLHLFILIVKFLALCVGELNDDDDDVVITLRIIRNDLNRCRSVNMVMLSSARDSEKACFIVLENWSTTSAVVMFCILYIYFTLFIILTGATNSRS